MEKKDKPLEKLNINHSVYTTRLSEKFKNKKPYGIPDKTKLKSFIPGTIVEVLVKKGDSVKKGTEVLVLEAMKMKNRIKSPVDGKIKEIFVKADDKVPKGKLLIEFIRDS